VRFFLVSRKADTEFSFDVDLALKRNDENPVFYVQYAYARMSSIFGIATARGFAPESWATGDLNLLNHPAELTLLRKMAELPEVVEKAALQLAPHSLAFYAQELAAVFHAF
jgi:arginyl-tRNA synthetase